MHLSGWHRLWILASVLWLIALTGFGCFVMVDNPRVAQMDFVRSLALVWILGSLAVLAVGHLVSWVLKGFAPKQN